MLESLRSAIAARLTKGLRQPGGIPYTVQLPTHAGASVSDESAMRLAAVHACVRVLSEDVAALPLHLYERTGEGKRRMYEHPLYQILHDRPNPEMSAVSFKEAMMVNALLTGNGYAFIEFDRAGRVRALWPLLSGEVTPYRTTTGEIRYRAGGENLHAGEVFHLAGMGFDGLVGLSPIAYARESIGLGIAAEQYGEKFFANGTHLGGVVSVKERLTDDQFARVSAEFRQQYKGLANAHGVAVLESGATYTPIGIAPEDAQFLETRKYQRSEIAAIYRVPPHMIGDLERATFSNIEQQDLSYLQRSLLPWLIRWEQQGKAKLIPPEDRGRLLMEHDTASFMRGDTLTRNQAYRMALTSGWITVNEVRARENLNPIEGGDRLMTPLNMVAADELPANAPKTDGMEGKRSRYGAYIRRDADPGKGKIDEKPLKLLREGMSEWMMQQAQRIEQMLRAAMDEEAQPRSAEQHLNDRARKKLLAMINDFYDELAEVGREDLQKAIEAGQFPGWRTLNDAFVQIGSEAWAQVDRDTGESLGEPWRQEFLSRYCYGAKNRLISANRGELQRVLSDMNLDGNDAYQQINGIIGGWYQRNSRRAVSMANNEVHLLRNEALLAGYRTAGYSSQWRSAPGCCKACTRMNGVRIVSLKPPLHKGCTCTVTMGEKLSQTGLKNPFADGTLMTDAEVREWIRSEACNKEILVHKQNEHIAGTSAYNKRLKEEQAIGRPGQSYIPSDSDYADMARLKRLVQELAGTGMLNLSPDQPWNKSEKITLDVNAQFGIVIDIRTKLFRWTNSFTIRYSKNGVHIFPSY